MFARFWCNYQFAWHMLADLLYFLYFISHIFPLELVFLPCNMTNTFSLGFFFVRPWNVSEKRTEWNKTRIITLTCKLDITNNLVVRKQWWDICPILFDTLHVISTIMMNDSVQTIRNTFWTEWTMHKETKYMFFIDTPNTPV